VHAVAELGDHPGALAGIDRGDPLTQQRVDERRLP
jgi:hypothetical protein